MNTKFVRACCRMMAFILSASLAAGMVLDVPLVQLCVLGGIIGLCAANGWD